MDGSPLSRRLDCGATVENAVLSSAAALLADNGDTASVSLHLGRAGYFMNHVKICCLLPVGVWALVTYSLWVPLIDTLCRPQRASQFCYIQGCTDL